MTFTFRKHWVSCSRQGENISFFLVFKWDSIIQIKSPNFTDPLAFPVTAKLIVSSRLFLSVCCMSLLPPSVFRQCRVLRRMLLGGHLETYRHSKLAWSSNYAKKIVHPLGSHLAQCSHSCVGVQIPAWTKLARTPSENCQGIVKQGTEPPVVIFLWSYMAAIEFSALPMTLMGISGQEKIR